MKLTMDTLILKSPAKINLFLEVLNKREDGFHNIQTIFQKINFCDSVCITKVSGGGISIKTNCPQLPVDKRNLAYLAAELLKQKYKFGGIEITIDKKIPLCSGLGGGSSNAAAVLSGIDRLYKLGLKGRQLLDIAQELGSDVPFFVSGYKSALAEGRGEILTPLKLPRYWFLLVLPDVGMSSKEAYYNLRLTRKNKDVRITRRALETKDLTQIERNLYNGLEKVAFAKVPLIKKIKQTLKTAGYKAVLMSGSGTTVFTLVLTRKEAMEAREHLRFLNCRMEVVRSI